VLPSDPLMRILMPVKRRPAERRARAAGARHGSAYRSEIAGHGQECGGDELAARRSCVQPAQADVPALSATAPRPLSPPSSPSMPSARRARKAVIQ
jgi:hypothetical protein